jgi:hypothetical protein
MTKKGPWRFPTALKIKRPRAFSVPTVGMVSSDSSVHRGIPGTPFMLCHHHQFLLSIVIVVFIVARRLIHFLGRCQEISSHPGRISGYG